MRKAILLYIVLALASFSLSAQKPRVAVIATGGTIAGAGATAASAGYSPAQITVNAILDQVPGLGDVAEVIPLQLCQISSQNMNLDVLVRLAHMIDSLFAGNLADGVVVTHGTDTMEESAYFINLTVPHPNPVVFVGSMRPSTSLSADGPMNLYNAISVASSTEARGKGTMILLNDYLLSADDVTKSNSVNVNAFECPNYGSMGVVRGGVPYFSREPMTKHTYNSDFDINTLPSKLPRVDIVNSYVSADDVAFKAFVAAGAEGIVVNGVGHGNATESIMNYAAQVSQKSDPVVVVRTTRVFRGGVTTELEDSFQGQIAGWYKSAQKARILLTLALAKTKDLSKIEQYFIEY